LSKSPHFGRHKQEVPFRFNRLLSQNLQFQFP